MTKLGLLKSGNLMNWWMIERRDQLSALKEEQCHSNSSLETTKQNQICRWDPDHSCTGWMIRCEQDKNNPQWMQQKTVKNILWYGECSCLQHWNQLYSWGRITQTIGIPSRIQKISQWNKCSTYLQNWCPNKIWDLWIGHNWLRKFSMEVFVFDWWWTSHQSSAHKSLRNFRFCTVVWVRYTKTLAPTQHGKKDWRGSKVHPAYRNLDRIDGEPIEFEWNIYPGLNTLQFSHKVQELRLRLGETPENFTGRIIFMSMFNDFIGM